MESIDDVIAFLRKNISTLETQEEAYNLDGDVESEIEVSEKLRVWQYILEKVQE